MKVTKGVRKALAVFDSHERVIVNGDADICLCCLVAIVLVGLIIITLTIITIIANNNLSK